MRQRDFHSGVNE